MRNEEYVDPIDLTEDILEKTGFKKKENIYFGFKIEISNNPNNEKFYLTVEEGRHILLKPILYVHELQNLYFLLKGEELKIKL